MNSVNIIGRLTRNPELKTTLSGINVCSITIAINRSYAKDVKERETDFVNIVAWRSSAEIICKHFKKGQMIGISGSIQTRKYEDKDGNKRIAFEVLVNQIHFTGSYNKASGEIQPEDFMNANDNDFIEITDIDDNDLPF